MFWSTRSPEGVLVDQNDVLVDQKDVLVDPKDILVHQKDVAKQLAAAISKVPVDVAAVRAALDAARQVELEETEEGKAARRMLIEGDLQRAIEQNSMDLLETAVDEAHALGHNDAVAQRARDALERLRREA